MTFPVAMIPYANMAPYRMQGPPVGCHFVDLQPRESIAALTDGRVLAACVPVGGLKQVAECTRLVGSYGIAVRERAMSVLFLAQHPLSKIQPHHRLHLTSASASSVRLLMLLLGYRLGFERLPELVSDPQAADGILLIGDRALVAGQKPDAAWPNITDLAEAWFSLTGLPFVFARWVVRSDTPSEMQTALETWLECYRVQEAALIEQAVPLVSRSLNLDPAVSRTYLQLIRRCLDQSDLDGQERFLEDLDAHKSHLPTEFK